MLINNIRILENIFKFAKLTMNVEVGASTRNTKRRVSENL